MTLDIERTFSLLGIEEFWIRRKSIEAKLVIDFENLSDDEFLLLKNLLFSINVSSDDCDVNLIGRHSVNTQLFTTSELTIYLSNKKNDYKDSIGFVYCPHPKKIIQNNTLKKEVWKILIEVKKKLKI